MRTNDAETLPDVNELNRFIRVFLSRGLVIFGVIIILILMITAVFAPVLAPYDPYEQDIRNPLVQPCKEHLLGTDTFGRDVLSRLIYGSRTTMMIVFFAIGFSAVVGMMMGLVAGYVGGMTYTIIMRLIDALMSFPTILIALVIAAMLGGGIRNVVMALGIGLLPPFVRLMCGQVLTVKESDYVTAARSIGASNLHIMLKEIAPNCFPPLIVLITMMIGMTILLEASLSFLGVGIEPPAAAWGAMVSNGYRYLLTNPILAFAPGFAVMLVVFAFNMVGDGLRDALDPRLRGTL